ncbi:DEAD/DEAH box helicase [Rhodothermus profundi]|uniref:Helicase conserved C-terminal domain-containing protein n=1 Tax=Rhodothermus profundi TaxID=633813 RepID=A0A1M6WMD3_9BACT|nr:DEAD/DEAH box helicase [Rhodothermus profundi]SHK94868.1 Helicase conserved C-terminal domain-containing protein [Rhodothermus profundi]
MMDAFALSQEIVARYQRYLWTTFSFRDAALQASFEQALNRWPLSRGPFVEATPPFRRGRTPRELFSALLDPPPDEGFLQALYGDRPLYQHQEEAIQKVWEGQNVIVATGTGSGKTEAFLYPILLHLYREYQQGQLGPGVRALVLYPMNALAHDQRERLGTICQRLEAFGSPFRFTFGQYIGETPENEGDAHRKLRERLPGELIFRREMRETPPHILLTNYSMLEYLLLRPDDSPLFDGGRARWWTFLVLDEAHQYRGTRGTEMALLLRRLKHRLRQGGRRGAFRCVATSATLLRGEKDREAVARFATDLFGEPFSSAGVVLSVREAIPEPENGLALEVADYERLLQGVLNAEWSEEDREWLNALGRRAGRPCPTWSAAMEKWAQWVGGILEQDRRAAMLRRLLAQHVQEARTLARALFPELEAAPEQEKALHTLLRLLVRARHPETGAPLLTVRYHLFLRALEGVFLRWQQGSWEVTLERAQESEAERVFEVALCRSCGQHYLVGQVRGSRWQEAVRDPGREDFGVQYLRPLAATDEENQKGPEKTGLLCLRCGAISMSDRHQPPCSHDATHWLRVVLEEAPEDATRADQLARCSVCGYTAGGRDPVGEVTYGDEGPHVVMATTLHQCLPVSRRRVLAFADGRQQAAFFAWYLEKTYQDILERQLLLEAARRQALAATSEGLSLSDLAAALLPLLRTHRILPESASALDRQRQSWRMIYREFLAEGDRISLEGVGLIRWHLRFPDWLVLPEELLEGPWKFSAEEIYQLLQVLLDTLRKEAAVTLVGDASLITLDWQTLGLRTRPLSVRLGPPRGRLQMRDWAGPKGRRVQLLRRILRARGVAKVDLDRAARHILELIWQALDDTDRQARSQEDRLLLPARGGKQLNPRWWRLQLVNPEDQVYHCESCGRLHPFPVVAGCCPAPRCQGQLRPVLQQALPENHYRRLYQEPFVGLLRVEEHTAQLSYEQARAYQQDFRKGRIHVLSCSTTFELGVDLGDLDVVFLRNVPPEPFNYAQRVGRAGRRQEPGFALTYCRRTSHDLYHFQQPERMLEGHIRPPVLSLTNEKLLLRHLMAWALARFFRRCPERFGSVEALVGDWQQPTLMAQLQIFLEDQEPELQEDFAQMFPEAWHGNARMLPKCWRQQLLDPEGRLALALDEVVADYQAARALQRQAAEQEDYARARWAKKRAETIASEPVLSFLSRKAVIPKYGFPVDVVELDTHQTDRADVVLQRDLQIAISEFAPTAEVIANKRLWKSYGLKQVPERAWPVYLYKRCDRHNTFVLWPQERQASGGEQVLPCGCEQPARCFVVPRFGFVTRRGEPETPKRRPQRLFSSRPYFGGGIGTSPERIPLPEAENPLIWVTPATPGRMVVLCEGYRRGGFYLCEQCGMATRGWQASHQTPYGSSCSGTLKWVALGHEFVTDVLRLEFVFPPDAAIGGNSEGAAQGFAYSLAYALVEAAAELLEVPATDLNTVVAYKKKSLQIPPILLYDDVPGGAGLVAQLGKEPAMLRSCLELAKERVRGTCGCGALTSCYGCLRSYRNQFVHEQLRRGPVHAYLQQLLKHWA